MSELEPSEEITIEEAVETLLGQVETLEKRLARMEEVVMKMTPTAAVVTQTPSLLPRDEATPGGQTRPRHRRYRADPFHGLFGYYFVLGILLLSSLGVALALTSSENLPFVWWVSAAAFTLFQIFFVVLGILQKDWRTSMNAAIGLMLAVLVDIGVLRFLPFPFG
ncbi:membrane hypothetical protein [Gammaproteobacteria bacterium]